MSHRTLFTHRVELGAVPAVLLCDQLLYHLDQFGRYNNSFLIHPTTVDPLSTCFGFNHTSGTGILSPSLFFTCMQTHAHTAINACVLLFDFLQVLYFLGEIWKR